MPKEILLSVAQQNMPGTLNVPTHCSGRRSSTSSNASEEDLMMNTTKWKTNISIPEEAVRVRRRNQGYRKNTSFENKIINDHIKVMIESVCKMEEKASLAECQRVCTQTSCQQSIIKQGIVKERIKHLIDQNTYLTEDQKKEFIILFTENYDNYQIITKTTSRLNALHLLNEELTFILMKVVEFISLNYEINVNKYNEEYMENQVEQRLDTLVKSIADHQNIRLISPGYFDNSNEKVFLGIIERWFYCAFCIKLGVYYNKYSTSNGMSIEM